MDEAGNEEGDKECVAAKSYDTGREHPEALSKKETPRRAIQPDKAL
jgi:hypothetical protein